ncbi:phosphatase PAP2 family protein [Tabrizicola caldifontis]|uniref:phosphatase PAP2 family protein n=1 Tax=Tabrizicola caldifontis TaxID=2528036 RepID=UPI001081E097|nr:phosphatase PAP2 family protein [Rhodobacter sp. YIM 73028]
MESSIETIRLSRRTFELLPVERIMLTTALVAEAAGIALATALQRNVNWPPMLLGFAIGLALIALGAFVRGTRGSSRVALAMVGLGSFFAFTSASPIVIFSLMPLTNPMVDDWLTWSGHLVGYDWHSLINHMLDYPVILRALGYVYQSSIFQLMLTVCFLAALNRALSVHRFMLVGMFSLAVTVAIWWVFPSVGYVGALDVPAEVLRERGYHYGTDRGGFLTQLLTEGPARISPETVTGVVGFPSYHMVMCCLVVWFLRATVLFVPALILNLAMIPATLIHGGHHLLDIPGGVAVFALCVWFVSRFLAPGDELEPVRTSGS